MSGESLTTVNANDITKNAATNNTKVDTNFTHLIRRPSEYFIFQPPDEIRLHRCWSQMFIDVGDTKSCNTNNDIRKLPLTSVSIVDFRILFVFGYEVIY